MNPLPWHTWNPQADPKAPLAWDGPRVVLIEGDPYRDGVMDAERDRLYAVAALCPHSLFVVVTEQPCRVLSYMVGRSGSPPPGGTSAGITPAMIHNAATIIRGGKPRFQAWPTPSMIYAGKPIAWDWPLPNVINMARVKKGETYAWQVIR